MSRAIKALYKQFQTEAMFGWYVPDRQWREKLRALYPVEWVSAHHRGDFPPSLINDHARRFLAFQRGLRTA